MTKFNVYTKDAAQGDAAEMLGSIEKAYGFVPNLYGIFAESPAVLKAYMSLGKIFDESSFLASASRRSVIT
jgi:hypothetical protein